MTAVPVGPRLGLSLGLRLPLTPAQRSTVAAPVSAATVAPATPSPDRASRAAARHRDPTKDLSGSMATTPHEVLSVALPPNFGGPDEVAIISRAGIAIAEIHADGTGIFWLHLPEGAAVRYRINGGPPVTSHGPLHPGDEITMYVEGHVAALQYVWEPPTLPSPAAPEVPAPAETSLSPAIVRARVESLQQVRPGVWGAKIMDGREGTIEGCSGIGMTMRATDPSQTNRTAIGYVVMSPPQGPLVEAFILADGTTSEAASRAVDAIFAALTSDPQETPDPLTIAEQKITIGIENAGRAIAALSPVDGVAPAASLHITLKSPGTTVHKWDGATLGFTIAATGGWFPARRGEMALTRPVVGNLWRPVEQVMPNGTIVVDGRGHPLLVEPSVWLTGTAEEHLVLAPTGDPTHTQSAYWGKVVTRRGGGWFGSVSSAVASTLGAGDIRGSIPGRHYEGVSQAVSSLARRMAQTPASKPVTPRGHDGRPFLVEGRPFSRKPTRGSVALWIGHEPMTDLPGRDTAECTAAKRLLVRVANIHPDMLKAVEAGRVRAAAALLASGRYHPSSAIIPELLGLPLTVSPPGPTG